MVMQVSAAGLRKVSVHRPSLVSSANLVDIDVVWKRSEGEPSESSMAGKGWTIRLDTPPSCARVESTHKPPALFAIRTAADMSACGSPASTVAGTVGDSLARAARATGCSL
jgi:hypothetical protein|tara:strand:+ start:188 stop:520 length:333 start_codon:yes stop_codon:yes gene_type:complete